MTAGFEDGGSRNSKFEIRNSKLEIRPIFGFRFSIFGLSVGLLFLYFFALNPKCWPAEKQDSGFRIQDSDPFLVYRYQANPFAKPELKLIALGNQKSEIRNQKWSYSLFPVPYSLPRRRRLLGRGMPTR